MNVLLFAPPSPDRPQVIDAVHRAGHEVSVADTAAHATSLLGRHRFELTIVDLAAGSEALRFVRRQRSSSADRVSIVCVADRRQPQASAEALRLGVVDILGRPVRHDDVVAGLANAAEMSRLARTADPVQQTVEAGDEVFGASPAMRDVLTIVKRVAPSRCGVLIVGERGTGREMVARAIHAHGRRHKAPFIKVVCADPTSAELENALSFGSPDGATIYLDELGELLPDAQVRVESAVSAEAHSRDLRMIASVQPRVGEWMDRGVIRRSLVEALAVVRIDLPPLRQRAQDIGPLALHFLKEACRQSDVPTKTFSRAALSLLGALPWPGNAAELRSLTERLAVLVPRGVVLLEDVLANVRFDGAEAQGRPRESLRNARERFERDYVTAVLQHHRGRMGAAARELGIERTNLYRKIKQLNIRWTLSD